MLAVTGDNEAAIAAAEELLKRNPILHHTVTLDEVDIVFGVATRHSEHERYAFVPNGKNPNSVQINGNGRLKLQPLFPTMGVKLDIRPTKTAISTQTELEISLVMDRSGSMAFSSKEISGNYNPKEAPPGWKFGDPVPANARWNDACSSLDLFLNLLAESPHAERVSLTTYNEKSKVDVSLTSDYSKINQKMLAYSQKYQGGATNVGDGIMDGLSAIANKKVARAWATRVMIVMTDGRHNTGFDPVVAARAAADEHVQIFTITFSGEADIARMSEVAAIGSGAHYHANNVEELTTAFKKISKSLPTLITY
jgi:hypothetical protein